ncbi:MAG TPA: hypothetical protein VMI54_08345 [Polyangiaceae bacterium]|nr:hypothetical protein [Polyangiaceae bacterium]
MTDTPNPLRALSRADVPEASLTRLGIAIFLGLLLAPGLFWGLYLVVATIEGPFTWSDMDWNGDGRTSFAELAQSADVGVRPTLQNGKECEEFFSLKDGLTVRVRCR